MPEEKLENLNTENVEAVVAETVEVASPSAHATEVVIGHEVIKAAPAAEAKREFKGRGQGAAGRGGARSAGGRPPRAPREKPEFDSKTIDVRRVTRVVSGGRRFSLSVAVALGDKNGRIGFGTGKALDTQAAIEKATKAAKKNMFTVKLNKNKSLPHDIQVKYKSGVIWMTPNKGKGIIAGSSARSILALAGINDVTAKFHSGTKNKINNARATMKALEFFTK